MLFSAYDTLYHIRLPCTWDVNESMRLIYKLVLLSTVPLLITVTLILFVNEYLTGSNLLVGIERAALGQFEAKSTIVHDYFERNLDLLKIVSSQEVFRLGDRQTRLGMLEDWESSFPGSVHRFYWYDGDKILTHYGEDVGWNPEELGLTKMGEELVSAQLNEPRSTVKLITFWIRMDNGALGVSCPMEELRAKIDSFGAQDVSMTIIIDPNCEVTLLGPYASTLLQSPEYEHTVHRLTESIKNSTLGIIPFALDGEERKIVAGAVPKTGWKLGFVMDEKMYLKADMAIRNLNILILGLAIIPILLIVYFMYLTMVRPLNYLSEVQQEIGRGNLDVRVEGLPSDEIGELGNSLNVMVSNLRALQGDLASSERRFRLLAENIPGVIYLCNNDEEYNTIYLNEAMEKLSGYPVKDFDDRRITIAKLFHPDDSDYVFNEVDACLGRKEPFHLVYRIRHRSGTIKWVEEFGTGVWQGDELLFLEGVISDITERKVSEEALQISENRYRALIEGANHPITILAPDTRILLINSVGARNLGLSAKDCNGQLLKDVLPSLYKITMDRIWTVLESEGSLSFEDLVELKTGPKWFWSFLQHIHLDEEPNAVLIMSYDITDRKHAEEALRYRLDFENLLADMSTNFINIDHTSIDHAITDALAVLSQFVGSDAAYIFQFENQSELAILSHSWENGQLEGLYALLKNTPIRMMPGWRKKIMRNQKNIMNDVGNIYIKSKDKKIVSEEVGVRSLCEVPLIYQDQVLGVLGLCNRAVGHRWTDDEGALLKFAGHVITNALQRKDAEISIVRYRNELERLVHERTQALEKAQEELVRSERLATLGQLTATVSHELRNPLGTIRGSFFTIAERTRNRGLNIERALERVERNILRCDTIIEELLDFTRSRSLDWGYGDPDAIVYELVEDYPVPHNLTMEVDLGVGVNLNFDAEKFRRCVINVLNNACEAMREIQTSRVCRMGSQIKITSRVAQNAYRLFIEDNGPGIPEKVLEQIFEPLFSTKGFGVGLGLTLVQQIMEQHGGGITIQSEPEKGTQILLWLPLKGGGSAQAT